MSVESEITNSPVSDPLLPESMDKDKNKTSRTLRIFSDCNDSLIRIKDESELLHSICQLIVEKGDYPFVWVGYACQDENKTIEPIACFGAEESHVKYLNQAKISWGDNLSGTGPAGNTIRTGKSHMVRNLFEDLNFKPWKQEAEKCGFTSVLTLPLKWDDSVKGMLAIYAPLEEAFDQEEIKLLKRLSDNLSFGIQSIRNNGERVQIEKLLALENYVYQLTGEDLAEEEFYLKILQRTEDILNDSRCLLTILDAENKRLEFVVAPSLDQKCIEAFRAIHTGGDRDKAEKGDGRLPAVVNDVNSDPVPGHYKNLFLRQDIKSYYTVPLMGPDEDIPGILTVCYTRPRSTDKSGESVLTSVSRIITNAVVSKRGLLALKESGVRFQALYDDSPSMFLTLSPDGSIISVNKFGAQHLGYSVQELIDKSILDLCVEEDKEVIMDKIISCVRSPGEVFRCEFGVHHKYEDTLWVRATLRLIRYSKEDLSVLMTCEDISEARLLSAQLEHQARHDSLTGLINRAEFERRLRRIITSESGQEDHSLCYLDLDQFKVINDTCGHLAGDELIRQVSDLLSDIVRKRDTLARLGGDEFAILMEHCSLPQATRVARDLLKAIDNFRFIWEGNRFSVGVSIGVVPIDIGKGSVNDILSVADTACYAAKDAGRNRIHVYEEDDDELSRRRGEMQWVVKIDNALEENRFCLVTQNITFIGNDDDRHRGKHYELLIRMRDENGEIICPGIFLPAAERYNLAVKLDRWVVTAIFDWLMANPAELEGLDTCSINLSGHTLGDDTFLKMLLHKFMTGSVPPAKICFEITETAAVANLRGAIQFIQELKKIGCQFSLDDFGTGLSSFNYLKNLPVDYLKIDGSFVREIHKNPIDMTMVRSINDLGKVMGKKIIAEFVENDEILDILKDMGVDYAQGYALGMPEILPI